MPLLGKKIFAPTKPLKDIHTIETVFTIPYTGEKFRTKSDYEKRCTLYKERIWTCQCTGHVNLSYEEAYNSERTVHKTIKDQFEECFEKPTLEIVHHATVSLDNLVDQTWLKIQQVLCVGEKVILKIKAAGRVIKGTIVMVDTSGVNANPTSNCSSPSSDKENSSSEAKDHNSPKKWLPPKLLPYKYSMRLEGEDKVINAVPALDISRSERPPSKDLLRLFIRAHTVRAGQASTSPWVVNEEMVKKYKLASKFADFLLSPAKMTTASIKMAEVLRKKRKSSKSRERPSKKQKLDKSSKSNHKKSKKSPKKDVIEVDISSDDEIVLSKVIRKSIGKTDDSDSDTDDSDAPLVKIKKHSKDSSADSSSDSEDEPLSNIGSASKKSLKKKKMISSSNSVKKSKKHKDHSKKKGDGKDKLKKKKKKSKDKEKGLKQMTLFEVASKKGNKSPSKCTPRKMILTTVNLTPAIVTQMVKAQKLEDQSKFQMLVKKAAASLTAPQRNHLPKSVKEEVMKKYEIIREKQLLAKMTPAEKEEYFKKKRNARKTEMSKRYEDQDLRLTPLPVPKLVSSLESLPNEMFGDIAMVTELISCYKGLLMPDDEYPIYSDALMKALCSGPQGFTYLSRVLGILLQTLLQDQIAEGYEELKTQLSEIPVNPFTASELVRLCLRSNDSGGTEVANDNDVEDEDFDVDVSQNTVSKLEDQEFYQLEPADKLAILKGLCLRIMGSYSVQVFMEEKQVQVTKLTKLKNVGQRELNEKLKKDKEQQKTEEIKPVEKSEEPTPSNSTENTAGLITSFYGTVDKVESDSSVTPAVPVEQVDTDDDIVTTIRSRRVNAAKVAAEKNLREEEKKKLIEKNMAEYKRQKEKENFEKSYKDAIEAARQTLRLTPIGLDRNHNRYWIFNHTTPGLYIEKGWVTQDYSYTVQSETDDSDDEPISKLCTPKKQHGSSSSKVTPTKSPKKKSTVTVPSIPHIGQNLWYEYDSVKDLDQLITSLHPQGMRESSLRSEIKKQYDEVTKAINKSKRTNMELRDSDGDVEVLKGVKREVSDMEIRLRNGGLGGVDDFSVWEQKLLSANTLEVFNELLLDVERNVLEKFLKGFMRRKTKNLPTSTLTTSTKPEVKEEESDEDDEDDDDEKEDKSDVNKHRSNWRDAVNNCCTFSRYHVLLGMLECCIKWEKSAENAKCKICRKKDNDDRLLLCDDCNQAFHMYCLRPALRDVPKEDWFCAACAPKRRSASLPLPVTRHACEIAESIVDCVGIEHEDTCAECGGDEDLIQCSECPLSYHTFCHDPQLRHPPRGHWQCMECKSGGRRRKKKGSKTGSKSQPISKGRGGGIKYAEYSSDEDYTTEFKPAKKFKSAGKRSATKTKSYPIEPDDTPPRTSRRAPSELSLCEDILNQLVKHKASWPFVEAVSKKDVPDYYSIIKHPMNFRTMRNKFLTYSSAQEFIDDLSLVFRNTASYNQEDSEIYQCMTTMEKLVSQLINAYLPNHLYSRDVVANGYHDDGYSSKKKRR